mmetsp:Transcript_7034/g.15145  ORF Transcript_7034/g.15145 Transcript_7034/m.15145 type:complete len:231 (-) Transcript_7034:424-1116(-)
MDCSCRRSGATYCSEGLHHSCSPWLRRWEHHCLGPAWRSPARETLFALALGPTDLLGHVRHRELRGRRAVEVIVTDPKLQFCNAIPESLLPRHKCRRWLRATVLPDYRQFLHEAIKVLANPTLSLYPFGCEAVLLEQRETYAVIAGQKGVVVRHQPGQRPALALQVLEFALGNGNLDLILDITLDLLQILALQAAGTATSPTCLVVRCRRTAPAEANLGGLPRPLRQRAA